MRIRVVTRQAENEEEAEEGRKKATDWARVTTHKGPRKRKGQQILLQLYSPTRSGRKNNWEVFAGKFVETNC